MFLARHLEQTVGSPDLAWWRLQEAVPRKVRAANVSRLGWVFGLLFWLAAVGLGWAVGGTDAGRANGVGLGVFTGVVVLVGVRVRAQYVARVGSAKAPARGVRISVNGLVVTFLYGLVAVIAWGFAPERLAGVGVPGNLARATSPGAVLARDRQAALLLMLMGGLAYGAALGVAFGFGAAEIAAKDTLGAVLGAVFGLVAGIAAGLVFGLGLSMVQTAWPSYMLTKGWLALYDRLPWSLMNFLADAHQRGVLRQTGTVYQFRHLELQRRLATRP